MLDFLPDFTGAQTEAFLNARAGMRPEKPADMFLIGLLHKKLSDLLIKRCVIPRDKKAGELTEAEIRRLAEQMKNFRVPVAEANSYEQAQVCCGGIDTSEVDEKTLEARYVHGLSLIHICAARIHHDFGTCGCGIAHTAAGSEIRCRGVSGRQNPGGGTG